VGFEIFVLATHFAEFGAKFVEDFLERACFRMLRRPRGGYGRSRWGLHRRQRRRDGSGGAGSDLAVFPAADYTPSNHSHFESADIWFGARVMFCEGTIQPKLELIAQCLTRDLGCRFGPDVTAVYCSGPSTVFATHR
jgi:hypothetical protein